MEVKNIIWKEMTTGLEEGSATTLFAWPNPNNPAEVYFEIYGLEGKTKEWAQAKIMKQIEKKYKSKR